MTADHRHHPASRPSPRPARDRRPAARRCCGTASRWPGAAASRSGARPSSCIDVTPAADHLPAAVRLRLRRRDRRPHRTTTCSTCCPALMVQTVLFATLSHRGRTSTPTSRRASSTGSAACRSPGRRRWSGAVLGRRRPVRHVDRRCCWRFGYALGFRVGTDPLSALAALPARDRVRAVPVAGSRSSSACWCGARRGAGHRVPGRCSR